MGTITAPERFYSDPDLVTCLRVWGTTQEFPLLPDVKRWFIGSNAAVADILIADPEVSHSHAMIERRSNRLEVYDLDSKNGLGFLGHREQRFSIGPGASFFVASTRLFALNEEMRRATRDIQQILGQSRASVDDTLEAAVFDRRLLFRADSGSDQARLGQLVHGVSLRRRERYVTDPAAVKSAVRGTFLLNTEERDRDLVAVLSEPKNDIRTIVCASSLSEAIERGWERLVAGAHDVRIAPLKDRKEEIVALLERWFAERGSSLRFADLQETNQTALMAHRWPLNLEELREVADLLIRLAPYPSERQAAEKVEIPRSNVKRWLDRYRLTFPLLQQSP